jgi:DNA-binding protein YbaB
MIGSKEMFEDWMQIELQKETLERLTSNGSLSFEEFTIKYVEPKDFDYSKDAVWCALNDSSTKVYKQKKQREFDLRNNT